MNLSAFLACEFVILEYDNIIHVCGVDMSV